VGRSVKEDLCGFPFFRMEDDGLAHHLPIAGRPSEVELPDGTSVHLDPQLFRVPERLFDVDDANSNNNNNLHGTVQHGKNGAHVALHKLVHASLDACDVDLRRDLANTVLLTGAGSQFKYFPERLQREVASLLPPAFKAKVVCPAPVERRFGAWLGGSVLASLGSFQQLWLSRAQYEELGPDRAEARFAEV
jgi:actin-related protein